MKAQPIQPQFMTTRQNKDYCLYPGLIDAAHRSGLRGIATTLLQAPAKENDNTAIVHAVATFVDAEGVTYTFSGIGDANLASTSRVIALHATRMAETRAKGRALRDALNIAVAAVEELADEGDDDHARDKSDKVTSDKRAQSAGPPAQRSQAPAAPAAPVLATQKQRAIVAGLRSFAGITTPLSDTMTAPLAVAEITALRSAPATTAQYAKVNERGKALFDAYNIDHSDQIEEGMTAGQAFDLCVAFRAEYDERQAGATPAPAAATPASVKEPATRQQIDKLLKLQAALGRPAIVDNTLSSDAAAKQIADLVRIYNAQQANPAAKAR